MGFLLNDTYGDIETSELRDAKPVDYSLLKDDAEPVHPGDKEKLQIPANRKILRRERLLNLLDLSLEQYGATMISGRAGTGKTTLASEFATLQDSVSWFSVEPSDVEWSEFWRSFCRSLHLGNSIEHVDDVPSESAISALLARCLNEIGQNATSHLIVLDNIHHLFDSEWFPHFFRQLIFSLGPSTRLLMLSRGKPAGPLWRLRSKQMLNVIEENLLDLTPNEAIALCELVGVPSTRAHTASARSFGRIGTFLDEITYLVRETGAPLVKPLQPMT